MIVPVGEIDAPIDPGFGRPGYGGGRPDHGLPGSPGHPDQGLPGSPGHPDHGLPGGGLHPGNRPPGSYPGRPDQGLPGGGWDRPVDPGFGRPGGGGRPDHPDQGLPGGGVHPGQLPVFLPIGPDNTLPPIPGGPQPPTNKPTPPGTIWPPLPPSVPQGKVAILVWISGVGHRYAVIDVPPPAPDQGVPPTTPPVAEPKPA
jgi:hypothetical protein